MQPKFPRGRGDVGVGGDPCSDGVGAAKGGSLLVLARQSPACAKRLLTDHDVLLDDYAKASREVEQVLLIIQRHAGFGRAT